MKNRKTIPECEDKPREVCGLFGVSDAAKVIHAGLTAQQHRGQEGAGIVASNGEQVRSIKGMGLLTEGFAARSPAKLQGHLGIGHVRDSTTGSSRPQNVQPIVFECVDGLWALAHNGNPTNSPFMRRSYQENGAIFQTSTDSEILMHLIAAQHSLEEIRQFIEADSLAYLSLEGLVSVFEQPGDYCIGCFSGKYPTPIPEQHAKTVLEKTPGVSG